MLAHKFDIAYLTAYCRVDVMKEPIVWYCSAGVFSTCDCTELVVHEIT